MNATEQKWKKKEKTRRDKNRTAYQMQCFICIYVLWETRMKLLRRNSAPHSNHTGTDFKYDLVDIDRIY